MRKALFTLTCIALAASLHAQSIRNIHVSVEGSLSDSIAGTENTVTDLTLTGRLTGADFACIRRMQNLTSLNLKEAQIVAGESAYGDTMFWGEARITENNVIPDYLFAVSVFMSGSAYPDWEAPLKRLVLPKTVTQMTNSVLEGRTALEELILPDSIVDMYPTALEGCTSLKALHLPSKLTTFDAYLWHCKSLKEITVAADNPSYCAENGVLFNKEKTILHRYPAKKTESSYSVPSTVKEILPYGFAYADSLKEINLAENLEIIDSYCFARTPISSISIPSTVSSMDYALRDCSSILTLSVAERNSFYKAVDNVLFNKSGSKLLLYPRSLTADYYAVPKGVSIIAEEAFASTSHLRHIEIPSGVQYIQDYAFWFSNLQEVKLPPTVIEIGDYAFAYCDSIRTITIPPFVTEIQYNTFEECIGMKEFHNQAMTPQDPAGVSGILQDSCTLYVPVGTKSLYESAYDWQDFASIVEEGALNIDSIYSDSARIDGNRVIASLEYGGMLNYAMKDINPDSVRHLVIDGPLNGTDVNYLRTLSNLEILDMKRASFVEGGEGFECLGPPTTYLAYTKDNVVPEHIFWLGPQQFKEVILPFSAHTVSEVAFSGCTINKLFIPDNIKAINENFGATVDTVYCFSTTPPSFSYGESFYGRNVYVPAGTSSSYQTDGWNRFSTIREMDYLYVPTAGGLKQKMEERTDNSKLSVWGVINGTDIKVLRESGVADIDLTYATIVEGGEAFTNSSVTDRDYVIPEQMFSGITSLTSAILPRDCYAIGDEAFQNCTSLSSITIPQGIAEIGESAITNTQLRVIEIPETVNQVGENAFKDNTGLLSVIWRSGASIPTTAFDNSAWNVEPNALLYTFKENVAENISCKHTILNSELNVLTLTDARTFYAALPFYALEANYQRTFNLETQIGTSAGWSSIVLPFTVQTISHPDKGELTPFGVNEEDPTAKHFWLRSFYNKSLEDQTSIKANTPYLIAMPNSKSYFDEYNITGTVTFSASNVYIESPTHSMYKEGSNFNLIGTYEKVAKSDEVYALSTTQQEGLPAGSAFIKNLRDVNPFEVYATSNEASTRAPMYYGIGIPSGGEVTGIETLLKDEALRVWCTNGVLYIRCAEAQTLPLYNSEGRMVRLLQLTEGENQVTGLTSGFYLVGKKKVVVK